MQFQEKLMIQTQENGKKPLFVPDLGPLSPNSGCQFFFSKIWLRKPLDHGLLASCTISKKTNDPILRKLSEG